MTNLITVVQIVAFIAIIEAVPPVDDKNVLVCDGVGCDILVTLI